MYIPICIHISYRSLSLFYIPLSLTFTLVVGLFFTQINVFDVRAHTEVLAISFPYFSTVIILSAMEYIYYNENVVACTLKERYTFIECTFSLACNEHKE